MGLHFNSILPINPNFKPNYLLKRHKIIFFLILYLTRKFCHSVFFLKKKKKKKKKKNWSQSNESVEMVSFPPSIFGLRQQHFVIHMLASGDLG